MEVEESLVTMVNLKHPSLCSGMMRPAFPLFKEVSVERVSATIQGTEYATNFQNEDGSFTGKGVTEQWYYDFMCHWSHQLSAGLKLTGMLEMSRQKWATAKNIEHHLLLQILSVYGYRYY